MGSNRLATNSGGWYWLWFGLMFLCSVTDLGLGLALTHTGVTGVALSHLLMGAIGALCIYGWYRADGREAALDQPVYTSAEFIKGVFFLACLLPTNLVNTAKAVAQGRGYVLFLLLAALMAWCGYMSIRRSLDIRKLLRLEAEAEAGSQPGADSGQGTGSSGGSSGTDSGGGSGSDTGNPAGGSQTQQMTSAAEDGGGKVLYLCHHSRQTDGSKPDRKAKRPI